MWSTISNPTIEIELKDFKKSTYVDLSNNFVRLLHLRIAQWQDIRFMSSIASVGLCFKCMCNWFTCPTTEFSHNDNFLSSHLKKFFLKKSPYFKKNWFTKGILS